MKTGKLLFVITAIAFFAASCKNTMDLTKRRYTKGYYFHKKSQPGEPETKSEVAYKPSTPKKTTPSSEEQVTTVTVSENTIVNKPQSEPELSFKAVAPHKTKELPKKNETRGSKEVKVLKPMSKVQTKETQSGGSGDSDVKLILLIILALFIPPLAMYLWDKQTDTWFIVDLVLFILAFSWFFLGPLGLVGLTSIIIAILRILGVI